MQGFPEEEVIRYMKVAFFCTQAAANRRPLMSQVVEMLSRNIRLNEKELTAPGLLTDSGASSSKKGSESNSTSYQMSSVPVTITQVTPRWGWYRNNRMHGSPISQQFFFFFSLLSYVVFYTCLLGWGFEQNVSLSISFPFLLVPGLLPVGSLKSCGHTRNFALFDIIIYDVARAGKQ